MNRDAVLSALSATMQAEGQREAVAFLDQCNRVNGFGPELLRIVVDNGVSAEIKLAAVIYLKNSISRYWQDDDEDVPLNERYVLDAADKSFIRENIIDAICGTSIEGIRVQLGSAVQTIARLDFVEGWPSFTPKLHSLLQTESGAHWMGALLVLYRVSKIYEYKRSNERKHLIDLVTPILPHIYSRFKQFITIDSDESQELQKMVLKILYCLTQFSLNFDLIPFNDFNEWIVSCKEILSQSIPAEVDTLEPEDRERHIRWKVKKWAGKILERVFDRYGAPGQVESGYADFASHFLLNYCVPVIEVFLNLLVSRKSGAYVSNRVCHLALSFITTGVSHAHAWKSIKPHFLALSQQIIFPFLSHTQDDEDLWEDDVEEFIRFKYDIFEDMHNPAQSAASLLAAGCKRKEMIQPVLAFIVQTLAGRANEPVAVDGALHMVGELAAQLTASKKYKKDCEKLIEAHVIPRLTNPSRFVRARAAWCLKTFACAQFNTPRIFKAVGEGVIGRLLDPAEELPVKVEAAICIQCLLDEQNEKAIELFKPYVTNVIPAVLELVSKTQVEELCPVVDILMEKFLEDVVPVAASIAEKLSSLFLSVISSENADEKTPTLMSVISTLSNILDVIDEKKEVVIAVERSVLRVIKVIFETSNIDYYEDALMLIQSLIQTNISPPLWEIFVDVVNVFNQGNNTLITFADIMPVLHQYITVDTEAFLARPERTNYVVEMCRVVLHDNTQGDDNHLTAVKLLEVLVLQCGRGVLEVLPAVIVLVTHRLTQPFEGLNELQPMCICVLVACLHVDESVTVHTLKQCALPSPNPTLDIVAQQLILMHKKFAGVHDRKMALLGWCHMLRQPADTRPSVIAFHPKQILESCIFLFEGLQKAMKLQAENRARDEDSEEEESDEDDDEDEENEHKKRGRKISEDLGDSEDEIDECTLEYLENLKKAHAGTGDDSDEDEDDSEGDGFVEETDTESYETPVDEEENLDIFVIFKQTMESFERTEPTLFGQMVNMLDEAHANSLRTLITECERHMSLAASRQVQSAGGYQFNVDAPVPQSFNFGG